MLTVWWVRSYRAKANLIFILRSRQRSMKKFAFTFSFACCKCNLKWKCIHIEIGPEPGLGQGLVPVLSRTFHVVPGLGRLGWNRMNNEPFHLLASEQGLGRTLVFITGNIFRTWKMEFRGPILQVMRLCNSVNFPSLFRCSAKGSG